MKKQSILMTLLSLVIVPMFVSAQQEELGLASFYSDLFHGKPTASGELYDKNKLTAAHKTLPFGTSIKITRLDNGKSVVVRVNDRGPYISGRIVEISKAAAEKIGLDKDGVTRVKVEVVKDEALANQTLTSDNKTSTTEITIKEKGENTKETRVSLKQTASKTKATYVKDTQNKNAPPPSSAQLYEVSLKKEDMKGFGVQVAAYKSEDAMFKKVEELKSQWFDKVLVSVEELKDGSKLYKVILGQFATKTEAEEYRKNLQKNKNLNGFVVDLKQTTQ